MKNKKTHICCFFTIFIAVTIINFVCCIVGTACVQRGRFRLLVEERESGESEVLSQNEKTNFNAVYYY